MDRHWAGPASMALAVNHIVRLPRWRKLASYSRQFMTQCLCSRMRWQGCWFSLNGKGVSRDPSWDDRPTPRQSRTPLDESMQQRPAQPFEAPSPTRSATPPNGQSRAECLSEINMRLANGLHLTNDCSQIIQVQVYQ